MKKYDDELEDFKKVSKEFEEICSRQTAEEEFEEILDELNIQLNQVIKIDELNNLVPIFVYGTLKKGLENSHYLDNAIYVDEAITVNKYAMYPRNGNTFPFVIKSEEINQIKGEVYHTASKEILDNLDYLERYPELYLKEYVDVKLESGQTIKALMYFKNEENYLDAIDKSNDSMDEWY